MESMELMQAWTTQTEKDREAGSRLETEEAETTAETCGSPEGSCQLFICSLLVPEQAMSVQEQAVSVPQLAALNGRMPVSEQAVPVAELAIGLCQF